uniref:Uncharacterized protein n=1 Tax=Anguilla anguilla TaxID=7936 RepID=A0A0E9VDZ3_ANGAN
MILGLISIFKKSFTNYFFSTARQCNEPCRIH